MRKGIRSIVFGAAVLIGPAAFQIAERIPQLQDFKILLGILVGVAAFGLLRKIFL